MKREPITDASAARTSSFPAPQALFGTMPVWESVLAEARSRSLPTVHLSPAFWRIYSAAN